MQVPGGRRMPFNRELDMRGRILGTMSAAAVLLFGMAPGADAQTSDDGWWTWALPQVAQAAQDDEGLSIPEILERARQQRGERSGEARRGERDREGDYDPRYDPRRAPRQGDYRGAEQQRQGAGPPFCRNGSGHPVHGWQWCVDKGWAGQGSYQGRYQDRRDGGWLPTRWEDVIMGTPSPRRSDRRMAEPTLGNILGDVILGRLQGHRDQIGASGALTGRWLMDEGARILQVRAGESPLAEFTDLDGDGRADATLLAGGR